MPRAAHHPGDFALGREPVQDPVGVLAVARDRERLGRIDVVDQVMRRLGANTVLTRSTPIIDVTGPEPVEYRGRVPAGSVVVSGTRPKEFPSGTYDLSCALIIGKRTEATDEKTALNEYLRELGVQL